jgi:membrane associated rhomboid family serine protease
MVAMDEHPVVPPPPPASLETCYRHPGVQTGVHCTRCNRPICTECMIAAPVGHQCPTCVAEAKREFRQGPGRQIAVANAKRVSVTNAILVSLIAVFVLEIVKGGVGSIASGPDLRTMVDLGAMFPPLVAEGENWRLFTAMFLHFGVIHLAVNAYSLYILGNVLERELGRPRFAVLYLLSGLAASAASYAFSDLGTVSAGASGAIFGIFGGVFAVNYRRRHTAMGAMAMRSMVQIIVLNVIINVIAASYLDWRAHVGGAVTGLVLGFAFAFPGREQANRTATAVGIVAVSAVIVLTVVARTDQIRQLLGLG